MLFTIKSNVAARRHFRFEIRHLDFRRRDVGHARQKFHISTCIPSTRKQPRTAAAAAAAAAVADHRLVRFQFGGDRLPGA